MSIDTRDVDEFVARLDRLDLRDDVRLTMQKSLDIFEQLVTGHTPVNTGALRQSIGTEIETRGMSLQGHLSTSIEYGLPVEFGRKPGKMPPVAAIKAWVIRKGIATGPEADSAAFLIARAIGSRKIEGAFMFKKGFEQGKGPVMRLWQDLPVKVIKRL